VELAQAGRQRSAPQREQLRRADIGKGAAALCHGLQSKV
jgi:hypothetical protein